MKSLMPHPDSPAGSITGIDADVVVTPTGCRAIFVATGDLAQIAVPRVEAGRGQSDDLWRRTCFEIFWQPAGGSAYREFNLSPSSQWASYDFDDCRLGMRNAPAKIVIDVLATAERLRLDAHIEAELKRPAYVALNAIIERADGIYQYWALAFADGAPDFHSSVCRTLVV